jgi:putative aldouronate transport system permease protein
MKILTSKRDGSNIMVNALLYCLISLFAIACVIPFLIILSASFTDEMELVRTGYWFWPRAFSLIAYKTVLSGSVEILNSYLTSIIVTVIGTITSVLLTILLAYPLSRKNYKYRNGINFFMMITLLFNGGMVPWYIVCTKYLHLSNSYLALNIPYLLSAWYVFILKSFLSNISESIEESARIDGAGNFRILFQIIVPLSLPGIATISLLTALGYWNDWWLALMLTDGNRLVPLQFYMMRIIQYVEFIKTNINLTQVSMENLPAETIRMAICILAIGPIIFAYPFFQKYFVKGLTVGSVKG